MNAHRQIIKPVGRFINIELPKEFLANNDVEVIILPANIAKNVSQKSNILALQRGLFSHLKNEEKKKALQNLDNLRNEWERDI